MILMLGVVSPKDLLKISERVLNGLEPRAHPRMGCHVCTRVSHPSVRE